MTKEQAGEAVAAMKKASELERAFSTYWDMLAADLPAPTSEHRFHAVRRFRFDYAWIPQKVAVELEGGTFSGGRHVRGIGFETDCIKYNLATADGWRVFRFTTKMLERDPTACIGMIRDVLAAFDALDVEIRSR